MWVRVLAISGLWLAAATFLIFTGRVDSLLADDAYYYFEIARNAAQGGGFTFDSLAATNGFHALWAWLLVAVFRIFPADYWLPIHVALAVSAICVAAVCILLFRLFARRGAPLAGEIATCVWGCSRRRRSGHEGGPLRGLAGSIDASLGVFIVLHFVVYVYVVGSYSNSYFLPTVLVACVALGLGLAWLSSCGRNVRRLVLAAHIAGFAVVISVTTRGHFATSTEARHRYHKDLGAALPKGTRIGLWNAGELATTSASTSPRTWSSTSTES